LFLLLDKRRVYKSAVKNQIGKETTVFLFEIGTIERQTNEQHTESKWIEKSGGCTSLDSLFKAWSE